MKRVLTLAVSLLAACASSHMTADIQAGDAENAIRVANSGFMTNVRAGNADALVNGYYAADAVVMPPNAPAFRGRDSIKQLWGGMLGGGGVDISLTTDDVMQSCDMATEVGHYDFAMTPRGGATTHELGKYVVTWKKINGQWRAVADIFNANAPTK